MVDVDYAVIGAGVYGAATAWWLARSGASVRVFDAHGIAGAASGGPGRRGVRANGRDGRELALMRRAYAAWPTLHEVLGAAPFYERTGHLLLAESETDIERAAAQAWLQSQHGIECELLDAHALRTLEPGLAPAIRGALFCPADGVADHAATTRAYAAAAAELGVEFTLGTRVEAIDTTADRATGVRIAGGERIAAACGVLVLANSAVAELVRSRIELPVWNECLQVLVSARLPAQPFRHLIGHLSRTVSLKTEGVDRIMVSGGWRGRWDAATSTGTTLAASVEGNVAEAIAVCPGLSDLRIETADAGHLESVSVDGVPIIDTAPGCPNLWYGAGWCGHGWAIAPVVSELLAEWVLAGERPPLLAPFEHARFAGHATPAGPARPSSASAT